MKNERFLLRFASVLILATLSLGFFFSGRLPGFQILAEAESNLTLQPANLTVSEGQVFTLEAVIETGTNRVRAVEINLSFDPTAFEVTNLANGSDFPQIIDGPMIDNNSGKASLTVSNISQFVTGRGTVAQITFRVIGQIDEIERISFIWPTRASAEGEPGVNVLRSTRGAEISGPLQTSPTLTANKGFFPLNAALANDCWDNCQKQTDEGSVATLLCIECVFARIVQVALAGAGLVLLIMLIAGGFSYLTAGDNPKTVEKAGMTLTYAFAGLIVVIAAWFIIQAISKITGLNITIFKIGAPPPNN